MKVIAIGTLKGGTGKTTVTFNVAGALAEQYKVLLIDIDPQCNLSNNVGIDIAQPNRYSSKDIFENPKVDPKSLVVRHPIPGLDKLDIIPSDIMLIATDLQIGSRAARERILGNYIDKNSDFFHSYDYIVIDTNPSMGIINQNAFYAADSIVLVADVDKNSLTGLQLFLYLWGEISSDLRKENNVKALIVNKADYRTNLTANIIDFCKEDSELAPILVPQTIRAKVAFAKAALQCLPITLYDPSSPEAKEVREVVNYLFEKEVL